MSYLTAYRSQSRNYASAAKAFKPPAPYNRPAPVRPANDNSPRPANDNIPGLSELAALTPAGRAALRRHPWVRTASEAYNLWKLIHDFDSAGQIFNDPDPALGWVLQTTCTALAPTNYHTLNTGGAWGNPICYAGSAGAGDDINTPVPASVRKIRRQTQTHRNPSTGDPRFAAHDYWYRPTTGAGKEFRLGVNVPKTPPQRPVLNPNTLPILQPMPLPVPVPFAVAPHRANDPIGSNRTYGQTSTRWITRRPPPPNEKEAKLRTIRGAVAIVQKAFQGLTEGLDFLDSFHEALPKKFQAKARFNDGRWWNPSPQSKVEAVWENFDQLDWNDVIKNLAMNEVEDRILGRANAKVDQFLNRTPIGRITRGVAF